MTTLMNDTTVKLKRGDTYFFDITVTNADDTPYAVDDAVLQFTMKQSYSDSDEDAALVKSTATGGITIEDALTGEVSIKLTHTDTKVLLGMYVWDLQAVEGPDDVHTLAEGKIEFVADVRRSTA